MTSGPAASPADLSALRAGIDQVDERLVVLLAERFRLTRQIGRIKAEQDIASVDPAREKAQIARIRQLAGDAGLNEDLAETVLRTVIGQVVAEHEEMRRLGADNEDQE